MSERQELRDEALRSQVRELCAARQAVMVSLGRGGALGEAMQVRMLELSGTNLIIDHPVEGGSPVEAAPNQDAEITCGLDQGLLRFGTLVRGPWEPESSGPARLTLAAPEAGEIVQRRGAYRVNLLETRVMLRSGMPESPWKIEGNLLNISSIGAAMSVNEGLAAPVCIGDACRLNLDGVGRLPPLSLDGKVVRVAPGGPYRVLLGIAWTLDEGGGGRAMQDHLAKFAAARQRPILRRRTGRA